MVECLPLSAGYADEMTSDELPPVTLSTFEVFRAFRQAERNRADPLYSIMKLFAPLQDQVAPTVKRRPRLVED